MYEHGKYKHSDEERECCYVDNKPVKNDAGEISMRVEAKQNA